MFWLVAGGIAQLVGGGILLVLGILSDRGEKPWSQARTLQLFGGILVMTGIATLVGAAFN
jgi:hypothetical protein